MHSFYVVEGAPDGSEQTAAVQRTLDQLRAEQGGIVFVPRGIGFALASLTFPKRSILLYFADDNVSRGGPIRSATNEFVFFMANANDQGIVNEQRLAGPFHPAHVIDVIKRIAGHDAFRSREQSRVSPARASYNLMDEGTQVARLLYQKYAETFDYFSVQLALEGWVNRYTLTGITTGSFASTPASGATIIGVTSGAVGYLVSIDREGAVLEWVSGQFQAGEHVRHGAERSRGPIVSATFSQAASPSLTVEPRNGNWGLGVVPGRALEVFNVGGKVLVTRTRGMSQHVAEQVNDPGYVFADNLEAETVHGFEIVYDTAPDPAKRRITLQGLNGGRDVAHVGACRAHTSFVSTAVASGSSFNVAGIVRERIGEYAVRFAAPFASPDYTVTLTTDHPLVDARVGRKTTTALLIRTFYTGTLTPADPSGSVDVACFGGDI